MSGPVDVLVVDGCPMHKDIGPVQAYAKKFGHDVVAAPPGSRASAMGYRFVAVPKAGEAERMQARRDEESRRHAALHRVAESAQ